MELSRWLLIVGLLVLNASAGCAYKNARQARTHQTVLATGWSCAANPEVRCGETGECSGWEDEWRATCPSTGKAYHCYFDRKYKNDATHVTCNVDGDAAAVGSSTASAGQGAPESKATQTALPPLPTDAESTEGYRESRWGMSPSKLQELFPASTDQRGVYVVTEPVAGKAAMTGFAFSEDRLTHATVVLTDQHVNKNNHLEDYRELKELLSKKYGKPTADVTLWSQDLYRDDPKDWGMAVSAGHLTLAAEWETEKTSIQLACDGERFKVRVRVFYSSKELKALRQGTAEKKNLDGL